MNCGKCKFEFCWVCLQSYKSYRHEKGEEKYCAILCFVKALLIFVALLLLVLKVFIFFDLKIELTYFTSLYHSFSLKDTIYAILVTAITDIVMMIFCNV